jgi:DnaJ-class molecular chaperone
MHNHLNQADNCSECDAEYIENNNGILFCPNCEPQDCDDTHICQHCNGSGEGSYDGSTCQMCKGKGEIIKY